MDRTFLQSGFCVIKWGRCTVSNSDHSLANQRYTQRRDRPLLLSRWGVWHTRRLSDEMEHTCCHIVVIFTYMHTHTVGCNASNLACAVQFNSSALSMSNEILKSLEHWGCHDCSRDETVHVSASTAIMQTEQVTASDRKEILHLE